MSSFADIRNPRVENLFKGTTGAKALEGDDKNLYYQGYLNDADAHYLCGYDYAVEEVLTNAFYNLENKLDDLEECGFDQQRLTNFERHYSDYLKSLEEGERDFDFESVSDHQIRLLLIVIDSVLDYAEMQRDEMGCSMIDSLDDSEREEIRDKVDKGYKNPLIRVLEAREKEGV